MFKRPNGAGRLAARLSAAAAIGFSCLFFGHQASAGMYVDGGLKDLAADQKVAVTTPQPVQLLFSFTTKSTPNAPATKFLKDTVFETVKASGLFSDVSELPTPNGALLTIVIDNLAPPPGLQSSAFATGLTFGLKGTLATDHYVCDVTFQSGATTTAIHRTGQHALHTTIGNASPPPDAIKAKNGNEGVKTMASQIVANTLNQVASDPLFSGATTGPAATDVQAAAATEPAQ